MITTDVVSWANSSNHWESNYGSKDNPDNHSNRLKAHYTLRKNGNNPYLITIIDECQYDVDDGSAHKKESPIKPISHVLSHVNNIVTRSKWISSLSKNFATVASYVALNSPTVVITIRVVWTKWRIVKEEICQNSVDDESTAACTSIRLLCLLFVLLHLS